MTLTKFRSPSLFAVVSLAAAAFVTAVPAIAADPPITDANIGAIVVAANQIDIDYGNIALTKSKNKEVQDFAQRMVTDHSSVQKAVLDLAAKLKLVPEDNPTSQSLKKNAVTVTAKLKSLKGREFDKFYIDNEVAYHTQVTDAIAKVLIPNAKNAELKSALEGAQPLFLKHLEHAKQIQTSGGQAGMAHDH